MKKDVVYIVEIVGEREMDSHHFATGQKRD